MDDLDQLLGSDLPGILLVLGLLYKTPQNVRKLNQTISDPFNIISRAINRPRKVLIGY